MTDLSPRQHSLLSALCECESGKGRMLGPEARRVAAPLLSNGALMWMGFGKVRVYSATDKGRAMLAATPSDTGDGK